jgi:ABC-type nitrate/sulfonate/bicarbonate transport system substrate-binding protein
MDSIRLGFKAFDPHELLPHVLAERLGFYREANLKVSLEDTTYRNDEYLSGRFFTPACGAALHSALRGYPQRVVLAATDRPMFWLCSDKVAGIQDLEGSTIASFPFPSPPHTFLRIILRQNRIDPDRDVRILPVRDDFARLGLLRRGEVDSIVLSSARVGSLKEETSYLTRIFFGDYLRVVSSGLATTQKLIEDDPCLVERMTGALRKALIALYEEPEEAVSAISGLVDGNSVYSRTTYLKLRDYFNPTGQTSREYSQNSIRLVAAELGIQDPPGVNYIYDSAAILS